MNPLTNMKNVTKLSEQELHNNSKSSWHDQYRDSAWVFIGGLPYDLTEGDIICIFSQYGEVVNINLIRDKDTGKSKGFCFLCYEDQRSTILAVDNLNGIKVLNRILRVDHVSEYKVPKEGKKTGEETKKLYNEGCAPKAIVPIVKKPVVLENPEYRRETLADQIQADIRLPARLPIRTEVKREINLEEEVKIKTEPSQREEKPKDSSESESETRKVSERKREKKRSYKTHDNSTESGSDGVKESSKKQKTSKNSDKKRKKRNRSKSNEKNRNLAHLDQIDSRNPKLKSRHRSRSRSSERRYRRSRSRDVEIKDYRAKFSNYGKNKYDAYRRRSES